MHPSLRAVTFITDLHRKKGKQLGGKQKIQLAGVESNVLGSHSVRSR